MANRKLIPCLHHHHHHHHPITHTFTAVIGHNPAAIISMENILILTISRPTFHTTEPYEHSSPATCCCVTWKTHHIIGLFPVRNTCNNAKGNATVVHGASDGSKPYICISDCVILDRATVTSTQRFPKINVGSSGQSPSWLCLTPQNPG